MRGRSARRLPGDRQSAAFSQVLEENQGDHFSRVHRHRGTTSDPMRGEGVAMGLYVHSLGEVPNGAERAYYVYLLDYGWEEPLRSAVRANLPRMADLASRSDAVVIYGPRG